VLVVLAALVGTPGQAFAAPPPNDDFADAQTIAGASGSVASTPCSAFTPAPGSTR
jgi:hypothetical protein